MATEAERQAYLDEMARARGYVLPFHKLLVAQDFEVLKRFNEMLEATYLSQRRLDRRTKELLFVATLTTMRAAKGHIKSHIRAAMEAGASAEEVLEAIELTLPEAGVVVFQAGFEAWCEVTGAQGMEPTVAAFDGSTPTS